MGPTYSQEVYQFKSWLLKQADSAVSTRNLYKILSPSPTKNNFHKIAFTNNTFSKPQILKKKNLLSSQLIQGLSFLWLQSTKRKGEAQSKLEIRENNIHKWLPAIFQLSRNIRMCTAKVKQYLNVCWGLNHMKNISMAL